MNWHLLALLAVGLLFTAGQTWFLADAWSFAVRTHTVWLIVLLAISSMIVVSAQTYLCAVVLSIYHDTRKPEGVTPVNRQAFASFPYDSTAYLIRRKGTADRPAVGWEVGPSLPYHALSIDAGETPEPTPPLDTPAPAPFDSYGGIRKKGNVKETGRGTEEEIGRVPPGVHRGKGNGMSRSSYLSPPTKASVETQESARVETPPDTERSSHGADEDAVTKDVERGIASPFDLVRSPAAQGSPREEKIESGITPLVEAVSPRAGEGQKRYPYRWDTSGILPVRQIALDIGEEYSYQEGGPGESGGTRDCDQSHNAIINHSGASAGFQAGLDVVRVSELSDVCAICLGKYTTGERVHVLPCLHMFHEQCLDLWIASHPSCPYCKGDLNIFPPKVSARRDNTRRFVNRMLFIANCPPDWLRVRQQLRRRDQGGQGGNENAFSRNIFV